MLVEIAFKGNRKEFYHWEGDDALPSRAPVIVEADRGEDLGYVHAQGELAEKRIAGVPHAPEEGVTMVVRRVATADEVRRVEELREQDDVARRKAMERVKANGLAMKVSDAEWRWDRRKLTLYFTAEKRVDFRNLVRELASAFRTRIELKQIGVRDEARRLGGIGRCGREYCSASWLPDLRPVNLGVARDQRLSLNPTQISGACGRLMCCLRYEHEFYVSQRKRFPKEGTIIDTATGQEKVVSNDIFRERVTLRNPEGETRIVPLADVRRDWKKERPAYGGTEEETPPIAIEGLSDEVLRMEDTAEMPAWLPRSGASTSAPPSRRALPVRDGAPDADNAGDAGATAQEGRTDPDGRRQGARGGEPADRPRQAGERRPRRDGERGPSRDVEPGPRREGEGGAHPGGERGTRPEVAGRPRREGRRGAQTGGSAGPAGAGGRAQEGAPEPTEAAPSGPGPGAAGDAEGSEERRRGRRRRGRRGGRRHDTESGGPPGGAPPIGGNT